MRLKTREMAVCAMMTVLLCLCSWLSIPAAVPFTLQTFGVFCTLLLLGPRLGIWPIILFLLMGAVGLPVFSGFQGGIGVLLGATGGYLTGFLLMGLVWRLLPAKSLWGKAAVLLLGLGLCYLFGSLWYVWGYAGGGSFLWALGVCVVPYLVPDLVKLALALVFCGRLEKVRKFISA